MKDRNRGFMRWRTRLAKPPGIGYWAPRTGYRDEKRGVILKKSSAATPSQTQSSGTSRLKPLFFHCILGSKEASAADQKVNLRLFFSEIIGGEIKCDPTWWMYSWHSTVPNRKIDSHSTTMRRVFMMPTPPTQRSLMRTEMTIQVLVLLLRQSEGSCALSLVTHTHTGFEKHVPEIIPEKLGGFTRNGHLSTKIWDTTRLFPACFAYLCGTQER